MEDSGGSSGRDQMLHQVGAYNAEPTNNDGTGSIGSSSSSTHININTMEDNILLVRKRNESSSSLNNMPADVRERIAAVKKRILEHKHLRLKCVKEKHGEHVAEWFYLQSGGNLMDYQVWRKKPQTPELVNFMRSHRLESPAADDGNQMNMSSNPAHGTEIKIPGVGATPVAVSTQLPAAVVQLSQLGHVPGRPQGGRHGMVFGQIPISTSTPGASSVHVPLVPGGFSLVPDSELLSASPSTPKMGSGGASSTASTANPNKIIGGVIKQQQQQQRGQQSPTSHLSFGGGDALLDSRSSLLAGSSSFEALSNGATSNGNNPDQFSVKAKQEVYVLQRVTELQREGLWPEKRLPKLQEPTRPKAHWDYVLEEMAWLSADFAQERKWKKAAAKKCARMVQKYFQDKAVAAQKAEKSQELQLKRIAAFLAKEIKTFWSSVEKLVEFKQQTRLEEKKKAALDQHLSFIVDQTEKLTEQLTEGMNKGPAMDSLNSSRRSSPKPRGSGGASDDEFNPSNADSSDDEETIAKEEAQAAPDVKEEVLALQRESEMDLDDFLKELPKDYLANRDKIVLPDSDDDAEEEETAEEDKEFEANENSEDDEDTIREQERNEERVDHKKEIAELNEENEMSIEQLMEKYQNLAKQHGKGAEKMEVDGSTEEGDDEEEDENSTDVDEGESDSSNEEMEEDDEADKDETEEFGLKTLLNESATASTSTADKDQLIDDAAALAQSIQPKGNTLSSTNVVTEVPFLLKHTLREYQHIGLDWLVTMHDRKLNGILADEMGLGKTIQTIALLAHLACVKGDWGPHLIIVPSSVMLNWEMEFKRWCPGFKILTYYGAQKERKAKRVGWTKVNAFHVCITSYKLVIQDHQSFRRKKWKYLILDEAQNIKNFKSQRWQLLLNFQTEQRLLLTGTPLQNNLMELWSLMHFLMPHVFQSHREFKEWFSNPMTGMIEGNSEYNESIVKRLHKVLRPFLLRRLKAEVEKQMPKKYEHVVMCRLSKRQRYLYEDFMSRAKTRETLAAGNLLSVINVLMQLRKVCNHPNLFEVRPTISPFRMDGIRYRTASLVTDLFRYDPLRDVNLQAINLDLMHLELSTTAYMAYRYKKLSTPKRLIEEVDETPELPPSCPSGRFRLHIKVNSETDAPKQTSRFGNVRPGTSPAMKVDGNRFVLMGNSPAPPMISAMDGARRRQSDSLLLSASPAPVVSVATATTMTSQPTTSGMLLKAPNGRHYLIPATSMPSAGGTTTHMWTTQNGQRVTVVSKNQGPIIKQPIVKLSPIQVQSPQTQMHPLAAQVAQQLRTYQMNQAKAATTNAATVAAAAVVEKRDTSVDGKEAMDTSELDLKEFVVPETEEAKRELRVNQLRNLNRFNEKHCDASPIFGEDLRDCMVNLYRSEGRSQRPWIERSYEICYRAMLDRKRCEANWPMDLLKTIQQRTAELKPVFENFVTFVPSVSSPAPILHVSHPDPSVALKEEQLEVIVKQDLTPSINLFHPIMSAMSTQFPDPRLIQYDCGKLQTLVKLLRRLKTEGHKVLIFTQMTRMLDVLESFLNYHGHIYLRLDGTTKVEQRQVLMERFNSDKRIFAFILSTRSGGVGVNLTGADTVIFYDSDWNPTMDAQAQDRCHRIGQTRDVHIYRLVSEKTVEENILKKANQKRLLGDLAIEGGNFTTAYFKSSTIQDLFQVEAGGSDGRMQELLELDRTRRERLQEAINAPSTSQGTSSLQQSQPPVKDSAFANALQAVEDEQDVEAAKTAQAEVDAELAEFDENIPIEEDGANKLPEMSKAEQEVENLVKQLSPIERYAMKFVEETGGQWAADKLRMAEADFEQQKREWEANRQAALRKAEEEAELQQQMDEDDYPLTYSSEDAKNQIWISENTGEQMPMWCPPTPPQDDNDIYTDHSLAFLYETEVMSESQLPPVYVRKEYKRSRMDAGLYDGNKRALKLRKEDLYHPPKSLFDRPSPALAKIRRDLKLQRYRGTLKSVHLPSLGLSSSSMALLKPNQLQKPLLEPEGMSEWFIYEDMAMLNVIQNLQGLPLNLMVLSPGHTVNWDFVADIVNQSSRTYRSPKQCRYRYEAVVVPREEGKLIEAPKKQKKNKPLKNPMKNGGGSRCLRTSQVFGNDNNSSFTKLLKLKIDTMKNAYSKKQLPIRHRYTAAVSSTTLVKNPKHADVLTEHGIFNYECPVTPADIAQRRIDRITKEKQKHLGTAATISVAESQNVGQQQQMSQQLQTQPQHLKPPQVQEVSVPVLQQQQQLPSSVQSGQTVVIQQHGQSSVAPTGNMALVQTASSIQSIRHATGLQLAQQSAQQQQQQQQQLMKTIVTSSPGGSQNLIAGQVQQITVQQQSPVHQGSVGGNTVVVPSSVSVVLTTPVSTLSTGQQQSQIVSIQPQGSVTTTMTTQSGGSIVHTLSSTSATGVPQKITVQQLAQQISSGALQTNAIPTSALRAQRIVSGGLQEVVLHQRAGTSQNPTVVSVSNLGQGLTQAQLQTQIRLQMAAGQPVSGVVAKGISVAAAAAAATGNKAGATQQLQFYRQQPMRQQLKVLHTTPTGPGQNQSQQGQTTTLVSPSIFQSGIVQTSGGGLSHQTVQVQQTASGQKVAVVSGTNTGAGVATVQVSTPSRTQFMKQLAAGKQTITRPVTEGELQTLVVKRQFISQQPQQGQGQQQQQAAGGQQHKTQVLSQAQIYAPTTVQVQAAVSSAAGGSSVTQGGQVQAGSSGQIAATLVKTSTGTVATGGSPTTMTFSQVKAGQIKTMTNPVRQMQMHQQMYQAQRKASAIAAATGKASPITQLSNKAGMATQLIVNKSLPVGMQQFQVIRHAQPGTLATAGLVLSKNMGRMIPASSQPNSRPTIQVVTATSSAGQALSGNLRATHVTTSSLAGTLQGAIKVASGGGSSGQVGGGSAGGSGNVSAQQQQQQALITALQNQNVSPVRLQTSGGSLVAVTVQQSPTMVSASQAQGLEIVQQGQGGAGGQSGQQNQNQQSQ